MRLPAIVLLTALSAPLMADDPGMMPAWEVSEMAGEIVQSAESVRTVLDQVRPKEWIQDGAPQAYVDQHESLGKDIDAVLLSAQAMGREPEKLSYVVDTFLWLDRVQSMTSSMAGGVRNYQSPAIADLLESATHKNTTSVERLKAYMRQLAVASEEQMATVHEEAQRCRAELVTRPR